MADTLDLLTIAEARNELLFVAADDTPLAGYVTTVSRRLDARCGAMVQRSVTETRNDVGGKNSFLPYARNQPITAVSSVVEYTAAGLSQVLTAETPTQKPPSGYRVDPVTSAIERRAGSLPWFFPPWGFVLATFTAGRYADTASVDSRVKAAARIFLSGLWRSQQGTGTNLGDGLGPALPPAFLPGERAALALLSDMVLPDGLA